MNVGHTVPLPIGDGDRTLNHFPSASNDLSAGISSCSISCRTSVDSAASIPMARTDVLLDVMLTEKILRVDLLAFGSGPDTCLEYRDCLEIVASAHFSFHA